MRVSEAWRKGGGKKFEWGKDKEEEEEDLVKVSESWWGMKKRRRKKFRRGGGGRGIQIYNSENEWLEP